MAKLSSDQKTYYFRVLLYGGAGAGKATTLVGLKKIFNAKDAAAINKKVLGKDVLLTLRIPLPGNKFQGKDIIFLVHTFSGQCHDIKNWEVAAEGIDGIIYTIDCHKTLRQIILGTNLFNQLLTKKGLVNIPKLYQYNKRDGASLSLKELQENINLGKIPHFETQANVGKGINDLFKKTANMLLQYATKKASMPAKPAQKGSREGIEVVDKELEVWDPKEAETFFKKGTASQEMPHVQEESSFKLDLPESTSTTNAEEEARKQAEEEAARKAIAEAAQKAEEEEARKRAEEEARKRAEEEARKRAEEEARKRAEEEARKRAEEEARKQAEEEARKQAEEDARKQAEEEAKLRAEEEAIRMAEEVTRLAEEEEKKRRIAEEARKQAEEEARKQAEEEAIRVAQEVTRIAEEEAQRRAEQAQQNQMPSYPSEQPSSEPQQPSSPTPEIERPPGS